VVLQFVHPHFQVPVGMDLTSDPKYNFKHGNWNQFVRPMDEEVMRNYMACHSESPKFGLVWLGTRL
jgi:hypothetical protein